MIAADAVGGILLASVTLYAVLGVATIAILRMLSRRWRRGDVTEEDVPYGPAAPVPQDTETAGGAGP